MPMTDLLPKFKNTWSPARRVVHAHEVERAYPCTPPGARDIPFCPCCTGNFTGYVYAASWRGEVRWAHLCSACAAEWVLRGGRIALAYVRQR